MFAIRFALTVALVTVVCLTTNIKPAAAQPSSKLNRFEREPLRKEPKTPEEMFAATLLMVDLIRPDLAAKYLEQFEAAAPDDSTLIQLRNKYGVADFLKLSRMKELQPRSTQLLERLNTIAKKQAEDPAFINALIIQLTNGPVQRDLAIRELRNAGVQAVPQMLKQFANQEMSSSQDAIVIALTKMGPQVIPPLIGALDSPSDSLRAAVINVLGILDATEAVPYLWDPAFNENQAAGVRAIAKKSLAKILKGEPERSLQGSSIEASNELKRLAKLYYRASNTLPLNDEGQVTLWIWDDSKETVVDQSFTPEMASLKLSSRFARQSLSISPDQPEPQQQYLASLLGLEVLRGGWEKPRIAPPESAMYLAMTAGESTVSQVLADALEAGQPATSVAALEVLSQIGSREQLVSRQGLKSPVISALNSPDQRVQFAAATTILKLDPKLAFSGCHRVVAILARSLNDPVDPQAIIIDGDKTRAAIAVGYLSDAGYRGIMTATGRDGFEKAVKLAGVDLIVIHVNCSRWELSQTLANFRADSRTAAIPIIIYGPGSLEGELARRVARSAPAVYVAESGSAGDFTSQVRPFLKNLKTPPLSRIERDMQKNIAVYWLSTIGGSSLSKVFDLSQAEQELLEAVDDPEIALNSLTALGSIGSGRAQQRLADVALNPQTDETVRETAANQLAFHIQRHGLLLTKDNVAEVESGWKRTENPRIKSSLASVIGTLRPNSATVGERLKEFSSAPVK